MILLIKNQAVFRELLAVGIHPTLVQILLFISDAFGSIPTVTSAYRKDDRGVHGTSPLRGIDLRMSGAVAIYYTQVINETFSYDKQRPDMKCAIYHDVGFGPHIHLQVHPNTQRISQHL
jgi:hypothetical protein